jgi:hypothetical protein
MSEPNSPEHNQPRPEVAAAARRPWEPMRLTYLGNAADLLQHSQGKMSLPGFDPGDSRQVKQRGQS